MNTVLLAIIATGSIGLIAAALLTIASKLMYVKVDPMIEKLREALPGANCGACGFSGCDGYAAALAKGDAGPDLCPPGGTETYSAVVQLLGMEGGDGPVKKFAAVRCMGSPEDKADKMEYTGIKTCFAAEQLYGGPNACSFGCLGYGDCVAICPKDAICIDSGVARIDPVKCHGCGQCAALCPRNVIAVYEQPAGAAVLCMNTEKGAVVRKKCKKGCIACMKCVRECPEKAIEIVNNLAVIDSAKCNGCGHCAGVCIAKCIAML